MFKRITLVGSRMPICYEAWRMNKLMIANPEQARTIRVFSDCVHRNQNGSILWTWAANCHKQMCLSWIVTWASVRNEESSAKHEMLNMTERRCSPLDAVMPSLVLVQAHGHCQGHPTHLDRRLEGVQTPTRCTLGSCHVYSS